MSSGGQCAVEHGGTQGAAGYNKAARGERAAPVRPARDEQSVGREAHITRMDLQDRRVKRAQNSLAKALIALTLEKGYEAVTIRDITQRADVAYATFFRHYHDKDALLEDVLDVVLDELVALLQPPAPIVDPATVGTLLFRYVREHSELSRVLLSTRGSSGLVQRIIDEGSHSVLAQQRPRLGSDVPPAIAANHLVASAVAL